MLQLEPLRKLSFMAPSGLKIVAAIPCYNTQKHIGNVVADTLKYVDEVVVVDDGSTDLTRDVAELAGARVISHDRNRGKGAAMKTAARNIDADIIVFLDGDGQHNPGDIPRLLEPILGGKADFVIGSRYLAGSKLEANPFIRKAANSVASLVISLVISGIQPIIRFFNSDNLENKMMETDRTLRQNKPNNSSLKYTGSRILDGKFKWISDCTSGFTAMRKRNFDQLALDSDRFQIETEIIFEQARNNSAIAETPIECTWDGKSSRLSIVKDGLQTLAMLTRKIINYNNGKRVTNSYGRNVPHPIW